MPKSLVIRAVLWYNRVKTSRGYGGVDARHGFVRTEMELKELILYILSRLPAPVTAPELSEAAYESDGAVGYFDFMECLDDLVTTGHITKDFDTYIITDKGRENCVAAESYLSNGTRSLAQKAADSLTKVLNRRKVVKASHIMNRDGTFTVKMSMSDGLGEIMSINLLVGSIEETKAFEKKFMENAEKIHSRVAEIFSAESL